MQEYWSGVPSPIPGKLPDSGIKLPSLEPLALADGFFTTSAPGKPQMDFNSDKVTSDREDSVHSEQREDETTDTYSPNNRPSKHKEGKRTELREK